jgi:hypothetical protein
MPTGPGLGRHSGFPNDRRNLDTGALIALEYGSRRMAVLVEEAVAGRAELAIPAGVVAQAWRGGAGQVRIARLLRASVTSGVSDVIDVSVALCARDRGHPVITSDPGEIHAVEPSLRLLSPT